MNPADGGLPKLKNLSVEGGFKWPMNVVTQLTTFKLTGPVGLEASDLIDFFRRNTSLESLELNNLNVSRSPQSTREEPIELPHLTKLSVRNAMCGCALSLLNLPPLKRLRVSLLRGRGSSDTGWVAIVGHSGLDAQSFKFTEFSPATQGGALFKALNNASLSSVTSLSLIEGMSEQDLPLLPDRACVLLEHLPRVERLCLRPSYLALKATLRLRDNPGLCPELRELEVTVTLTCWIHIFGPVSRVVKARGGTGRRMRRIEYLLDGSEREREAVRVEWDRLWRDMELDRYIGDE